VRKLYLDAIDPSLTFHIQSDLFTPLACNIQKWTHSPKFLYKTPPCRVRFLPCSVKKACIKCNGDCIHLGPDRSYLSLVQIVFYSMSKTMAALAVRRVTAKGKSTTTPCCRKRKMNSDCSGVSDACRIRYKF
jgi:hypothetical protein